MSQQPTVLCVDDETHILYVVALKLRGGGFKVLTAEDGEEGAAAAISHRPDLIITDYQMPRLSGLQMCNELKQHEQTRTIPVVLLTGRGFTIKHNQLSGTNIRAVLSKPFSPRDVLARARELTSQSTDSPTVGEAA